MARISTLSVAAFVAVGLVAAPAAHADRRDHGRGWDQRGWHGGARGFHHHHHHRGGPYLRYYYSPVVPVYPLASNCGYYHRMWKRTGRYYWKAKYYDCMDW